MDTLSIGIVVHRHMRIQRIILEYHRNISVLRFYIVYERIAYIEFADSDFSSRPAIIRSVVDFPQPDALTKTIKSLSLIPMVKSFTAFVPWE